LRSKIASGAMRDGDKLPTERTLAEEFGVSRAAIREALAALRSDGLLTARRGSGTFVVKSSAATPAKTVAQSITEVLDILELRMAVEVDAVRLATVRATWAQRAEIDAALRAMERTIEAGEPTPGADRAFHNAIARATNNPVFVRTLEGLGERTIPRHLLQRAHGEENREGAFVDKSYLRQMQAEHEAIAAAIAAGTPEEAAERMREHLACSRERYRAMI
ncbi:MAG: FadR/GntR family transcriptional regulator, partial [Pseudomonadota bacterium]